MPFHSPQSPTEVRVMNRGSSSLKFSLVDHSTEEVRVQGLAESLGTLDAVLHLSPNTGNTTY
jgi:acetate kinase